MKYLLLLLLLVSQSALANHECKLKIFASAEKLLFNTETTSHFDSLNWYDYKIISHYEPNQVLTLRVWNKGRKMFSQLNLPSYDNPAIVWIMMDQYIFQLSCYELLPRSMGQEDVFKFEVQ